MAHPGMLYLRLWQLGLPAFAALVGIAAGLSPQLGLAAGLGAAFVALVLSDLAIGLVLFILVAFVEGLADLGQLSLPKAAGILLVGSWVLSRTRDTGGRNELMRGHPALVVLLISMFTWVTVSAVWAEQPGTALASATRWGPNLALFAIVYAAIRHPRNVRWLYGAILAGALLSAVTGAAMAGADGGSDRLGGAGLNANELGALLAVAIVLAGALAACRDLSSGARTLALVGGGVAIVTLMLTASRGALLGLVASLLLAPVLVGPGRRVAAVVLALVTVGCAFTYTTMFAPDVVIERLFQADSTGSGRTDIWKVGWRIVEDRPILGVGADNFTNSTVHYLLEPGSIPHSDYIVDTPKVAHNIYLQVLAELGVVGLALFLSIIVLGLSAAMSAARRFARRGERSMEILARGLVIAQAGWLASAFFSSAIYSKHFWLLMGVCVALGPLARRRPAPATARAG